MSRRPGPRTLVAMFSLIAILGFVLAVLGAWLWGGWPAVFVVAGLVAYDLAVRADVL